MTEQEDLQGETVKLLRQLAEDLEAGKIRLLGVKIDDSWRDDPIRGKPLKILTSRTWSMSGAIAPKSPYVLEGR